MPRRRLYGETQKRRKKPQTRLLKRAVTPVRVRATQQPAPFERSPQVEREDLEFLEAMRELEVQRSPWRRESSARREAVERVQFLADDEEGALFLRSMSRLGVTPLDGAEPHPAPASAAPAPEANGSGGNGAAAPPAPVGSNGSKEAPGSSSAPQEAREPTSPAPAEVNRPAAAPDSTAFAEGMEFETDEDAQDLMEALLREGEFEPGLKFAGAVAPPRRGRPQRAPWEDPETEPDDELDLHGKTQEEAIRMVQSFLLVGQRLGLRHVLIITGRGRNSGQGGPVLKEAVQRWLELNGKRFVRAFAPAPARLGGEGAFWVTLR